jgi:uncharacterized DUF497 family protein
MLRFDWDKGNIPHIAEHGVSTDEAEEVVSNNPLDIGKQTRDGEERLMQIGATLSGRVLVVITTLRGVKTRVVTAYPAPPAYRAFYSAHKGSTHHEKENPSRLQE